MTHPHALKFPGEWESHAGHLRRSRSSRSHRCCACVCVCVCVDGTDFGGRNHRPSAVLSKLKTHTHTHTPPVCFCCMSLRSFGRKTIQKHPKTITNHLVHQTTWFTPSWFTRSQLPKVRLAEALRRDEQVAEVAAGGVGVT